MNKNHRRANELHDEIEQLNNFLFVASKVWTGKINLNNLSSCAYGMFESRDMPLNAELKNRILGVLEEYRNEKEEIYNKLFIEEEAR